MLLRLTLCALLASTPAFAQETPKPMDMKGVDPSLVADMYGTWVIKDESGKKRCEVVLKKAPSIGGSQIEVKPGCGKVFPVMNDISAWWIGESWAIVMIDPLRKVRLVFTTPDDTYVARDEVDGIFTIGPKN